MLLKRYNTSLLVLLFLVGTFTLNAQKKASKTIHLIRMLDNYSSGYSKDAGYAMHRASDNIGAYFASKGQKIADDLEGFDIKYYDLFDPNDTPEQGIQVIKEPAKNRFSKDSVIHTLQNISCEGDIVIVVYNGHGFTAQDNEPVYDNRGHKTNYPDLIFQYTPPAPGNAQFIPYKEILCRLQLKKPALLLSVVSACQVELEAPVEQAYVGNYKAYTKEFRSHFETAGKQKADYILNNNAFAIKAAREKELFDIRNNKDYDMLTDNQTLSVELLSCSKGEYTWVDAEGGHFMTSFINALDEALESPESMNWEYIAANTKYKTEQIIKAYNTYEEWKGNVAGLHAQKPQCKVLVKGSSNVSDCNATPRSLPLPSIRTGKSLNNGISNQTFYEYTNHLSGKRKTPLWLARRFVKLGESYRTAGSIDQAIKTLKTAIPVLKRNKNNYRLATAHERLGLAYRDKEELKLAHQQFQEARKLFVKLNVDGSISVIDGLIRQLNQ